MDDEQLDATEKTTVHYPQGTLAQRGDLMMWAATVSVATAIILILLKWWAWSATGLFAVQASLFDSLLDAVSSLSNWWIVKKSLAPPDQEHRFGHGKLEGVGSLLQSLLIGASSLYLLSQVFVYLEHPRYSAALWPLTLLFAAASVLTLGLMWVQHRVILRTDSVAIRADALHYRMDLAMNAVVVISGWVYCMTGWTWVDPVLGALIALMIGKSAWSLGLQALDMLMDREIPEEMQKRIVEIVGATPGVDGMHDLKTRRSGTMMFIQFHAEMDGQWPLVRTHHLVNQLEDALREIFPEADILIHQDPVELYRDAEGHHKHPGGIVFEGSRGG